MTIQITEQAKQRILELAENAGLRQAILRISRKQKTTDPASYDLFLERDKPPNPDDVQIQVADIWIRLAGSEKDHLKDAVVEWVETQTSRTLCVTLPPSSMTEKEDADLLRPLILQALRTVYDPEIPVNVYDLGLVYAVDLDQERNVTIRMTLTAPNCPVAGELPWQVQKKVAQVPGVSKVDVKLVWDPPWNKDMMSEAAKLELGL